MRTLILAGAAALAFSATPSIAQDMDRGAYNMTPTQQQMFMDWEDEQRIAYTRWPVDVQAYYWTLNDDQMRGWWVLNDEQRMRIVAMQPQQRAAAWTSIMNQMAGASPMPANQATATQTRPMNAVAGNIRFVSDPVVQPTPYDEGPPVGDVPICDQNDYDNCINAWEAGRRGPSVTKPLGYWPGSTADPRAGE